MIDWIEKAELIKRNSMLQKNLAAAKAEIERLNEVESDIRKMLLRELDGRVWKDGGTMENDPTDALVRVVILDNADLREREAEAMEIIPCLQMFACHEECGPDDIHSENCKIAEAWLKEGAISQHATYQAKIDDLFLLLKAEDAKNKALEAEVARLKAKVVEMEEVFNSKHNQYNEGYDAGLYGLRRFQQRNTSGK